MATRTRTFALAAVALAMAVAGVWLGTARDSAPRQHALPFEHAEVTLVTVGPDRRALHVEYIEGMCVAPVGVVALETRAEVRLTAHVRSEVGPGEACGTVGYRTYATVVLSRPLGDRYLVDSRTGQSVPVAVAPSVTQPR